MPCTVRRDELGVYLPLPQPSVRGVRAEAARCSATAAAGRSPVPAQRICRTNVSAVPGELKAPAFPLRPGAQLAYLQVSTSLRLWYIAACWGVHFNVL